MKHSLKYFVFTLLFMVIESCFLLVEPEVDTLYVKGEDHDRLRKDAIAELYTHYSKSKKNKKYYEVISKKYGRFILNYYPEGKLLTLCTDPGSGWSSQFKNVDEAKLKELLDLELTFDDINNMKGPLEENDKWVIVKTNGSPS